MQVDFEPLFLQRVKGRVWGRRKRLGPREGDARVGQAGVTGLGSAATAYVMQHA